MKDIAAIYSVLSNVYKKDAYVNIELNSAIEGNPEISVPFVTRTVYGVIDKEFEFNYRISRLVSKSPKSSDRILLKIGMFLLLYSDKANHAIVNKVVAYAKKIKKNHAFINALLRNLEKESTPSEGLDVSLSIKYNLPDWVISKMMEDYGRETAIKIISNKGSTLTHVRVMPEHVSNKNLMDFLKSNGSIPTKYGYYVTHSTMNDLRKFVCVQSLGSIVVCSAAKVFDGCTILDLCAAPGGKSLNFAHSAKDVKITACDIHEHRVGLIESYANSLGLELRTKVNDARIFNPELLHIMPNVEHGYDIVVCDVPCSGFGVLNSRPDIVLKRKEEDILELSKLQLEILDTSSQYVKTGGILMYSTCTYFDEENTNVINKFLEKHKGVFVAENIEVYVDYIAKGKFAQMAPFISDGAEGFFVARLRRL